MSSKSGKYCNPCPFPIPIIGATGAPGPTGPTEPSCIRTDPNNGCSVAEGANTVANGFASHAEGFFSVANGFASHAEGDKTLAQGHAAHAEGCNNQAIGDCSHAEGDPTIAIGKASHAEGTNTQAFGVASHTEGTSTQAFGVASHSEGNTTIASGISSHVEGEGNTASGRASHAEGGVDLGGSSAPTLASGLSSHAEGTGTKASGIAAHAEGGNTTASGDASHTEGFDTKASGVASHAEGGDTTASGDSSHAEGIVTTASGEGSHAEGEKTTASGFAAHAEGIVTTASGDASHSEGNTTIANANNSHAEGEHTNTAGFQNAHIMGRFGDAEEADSWFIGNGTSDSSRGLGAKWLASNGQMYIDGTTYNTGGADVAEMFETIDGNSIDVGYFITLEENKIRVATSSDDFILGISSATPSLLGDSAELSWHGRYVLDEWGRRIFHEVTIPARRDRNGNEITPEGLEIQPVINPQWDPQREYIPRKKRPEWVPVGLIGKILVRDDGTCQANEYCLPNDEGIATATTNGYRVMKRTGPNQVLILFSPDYKKDGISNVEQLEKLVKLREQGYLTEEEFNKQKQILLNS